MSEFDELIKMLDESGIPYERDDDSSMTIIYGIPCGGIQRIKYPKREDFVCSVIYGHGTYGFESGKLEIMGLLTPEEEKYDSVVGYLTAKEVFDRINKHYKVIIFYNYDKEKTNEHEGLGYK